MARAPAEFTKTGPTSVACSQLNRATSQKCAAHAVITLLKSPCAWEKRAEPELRIANCEFHVALVAEFRVALIAEYRQTFKRPLLGAVETTFQRAAKFAIRNLNQVHLD